MSVTLSLKQDVCDIKSETRCLWHKVRNNMYVALSLNKMSVTISPKQDACDIKSETRCMWH